MKRAFTLVELLVVVAIIVILIAILIPSLEKAIQQAELAVCGTTLNQMGVAQGQYGLANRGAITRFTRDMFGSDWNGGNGVTDTHKGTWYHWPAAGNHQPMLAYHDVVGYQNTNGIGYHTGSTHLYFAGLLRSPKSFYCAGDPIRKANAPGQQDSTGFFRPSYNDGKVYSSYAWNPMMTFSSRRPFTRLWENWERGTPAENLSTGRGILAMDMLFDQTMGSSHAPYWNLLHFDGSVGRAEVREFAELDARNEWVKEVWDTYFDYLDTLLEFE